MSTLTISAHTFHYEYTVSKFLRIWRNYSQSIRKLKRTNWWLRTSPFQFMRFSQLKCIAISRMKLNSFRSRAGICDASHSNLNLKAISLQSKQIFLIDSKDWTKNNDLPLLKLLRIRS